MTAGLFYGHRRQRELFSRPKNDGVVVGGILQSTLRNRLLTELSADDFMTISSSLVPIDLPVGTVLIEPDERVVSCWFLETGICSVVASTPEGRQAEAGLIGRDGVVDTAAIHGTDRTPLLCFIQIAGRGHRMPSELLRQLTATRPAAQRLFLAYAQSFFVQVAHTALANAAHTIAQRLARWLLMSHDRSDGDAIHLTHERLSLMLGVRRAGVTVAIQALERRGLVAARRGVVTIVARARLETFATDSYGVPEAEYERLIGDALRG